MALKLIANYSKRLGLPNYSSHQFSVCVETEISNIDDVAGEISRLYDTLQKSVGEEIQSTGFVPDQGYGITVQAPAKTRSSIPPTNGMNGNGSNSHNNGSGWHCSDKQRDLILKLVGQHGLDKQDNEDLSQQMFGAAVNDLNKLKASGLIDRILEEHAGDAMHPVATEWHPVNATTATEEDDDSSVSSRRKKPFGGIARNDFGKLTKLLTLLPPEVLLPVCHGAGQANLSGSIPRLSRPWVTSEMEQCPLAWSGS